MNIRSEAKKKHKKNGFIAVVYLARKQQGLNLFQDFIKSYKENHAGIKHDLIIIYKGFNTRSEIRNVAKLLDIPHIQYWVNDFGFDITAYLKCASTFNYDNFCFFNTYSIIRADNWLNKMMIYKKKKGVGIVGAMGSYESISTSWFIFNKITWLIKNHKSKEPSQLKKYFRFFIKNHFDDPVKESLLKKIKAFFYFLRNIFNKYEYLGHSRKIENDWKILKSPGHPFFDHGQFPEFPNPHIRTNGFIVSKKLMLEFNPEAIQTKLDACRFESGQSGLTSKVFQRGLKAYIVDRNGNGFDCSDWPSSATFRIGMQNNLLVTDNQTRAYDSMTLEEQATHSWLSWGIIDRKQHPNLIRLNSNILKGALWSITALR